MASIDNDMAVASCYRVRVQLGKGNFSSVYLAEHIDTVHSESSPLVVLKVPQPSVMARFGVADFELKLARKEIANLRRNQFTSNSALNADGFAKLLLPDDAIGSGQLGYAALLFTDLCGPSVFEYTRGLSGTHLPWAKAQQTIADVVDALLFLHANGIGHGGKHRLEEQEHTPY
jgi:serine/threonine protein kinase